MAEKLSAVKGMNDILPPDSARWEWLEGDTRLVTVTDLSAKLPPPDAPLAPPSPLTARLRDLSPEHLDVFQTVLVAKTFAATLDQSPLDDLRTGQILAELISKGYVAA